MPSGTPLDAPGSTPRAFPGRWNGRKAWKKRIRGLYEDAFGLLSYVPAAPHLAIRSRRCGFFGDVFMTLNGLRFAQLRRIDARVMWGAESLYYDESAGPNVWDYYFKTSHFDFRDKPERGVAGLGVRFLPDAESFVEYAPLSVRQSCAEAIGQWCVLHDDIAARLDRLSADILTGPANLGVHIRLTDAAQGIEYRHALGLDDYVEAARAWLDAHPGGRIFVATDDAGAMTRMQAEFGAIVSGLDCLRSSDGTSIHGHYDAGVSGPARQKGLDVILDAFLLARCDHLICTQSRVTAFAMCVNPALGFTCLEERKTGQRLMPWLWG